MKVRRVMPEEGWTPMANTAHRDYRLTWRARGLLGELLSYPDGWDINIDKLVAQAREVSDVTEGRAAMRTAMKELAEIGYVRYIRERDEHGRWTTDIAVCDVPQPEPDARRTRNRTVGKPARRNTGTSEDRAVGEPDCRDSGRSEDRPVTKKTDLKTVINTEDQITVERTEPTPNTSDRFAPSGVGDDDSEDRIVGEPEIDLAAELNQRTTFVDWRVSDLQRLANIIGSDHVISDGTGTSAAGTYSVKQLYDALRFNHKNPKIWPGKWGVRSEKNAPGGSGAVVEWLARDGITPGEPVSPSNPYDEWSAA